MISMDLSFHGYFWVIPVIPGTSPGRQVTFDRDDDFVRAVADHLASRFHEATAQDSFSLSTNNGWTFNV